MVKTGVIHGRFQMLHLKHMEYILAAKMNCEKLIIGIVDPDAIYLKEAGEEAQRLVTKSNPFTYYERFEMIKEALLDFGVALEEFEIVPFPIVKPEHILNYVPREAIYYIDSGDKRSKERQEALVSLGLKVEPLWDRKPEDRGITSEEVRAAIRHEKAWKQLVPKTVYHYILDHGIDKQIKDLAKK